MSLADTVYDLLPASCETAKAAHNIARAIWPDYGSLRKQAGRVAAVSRVLNCLQREGRAKYLARVIGRVAVTEWWKAKR